MGKILKDSEKFILQWRDEDDNKSGFWSCKDYEEAVHRMERYKQNDNIFGDNFKYRIVKETTKQEVVYNDKD